MITTVFALLAPLVLAASPATPGPAYVSNCGTLQAHPTAIVLTCADANYALSGLTWSDWGRASAAATGQVQANDCTPNCAAGLMRRYTATVVADRLDRCAGKLVYLRLTLTFPGDRPSGRKSPDTWTFTCGRLMPAPTSKAA